MSDQSGFRPNPRRIVRHLHSSLPKVAAFLGCNELKGSRYALARYRYVYIVVLRTWAPSR